jgi:tellurite resistance protein
MTIIKKHRYFILISALTVLIFFCLALNVSARAGGGGSFGGGYSGGGGSFGGGSFNGGSHYSGGAHYNGSNTQQWAAVMMFISSHPIITLLIIAGILWFIVLSMKARSGYITNTIRRSFERQSAEAAATAETAILKRDPAFSREALAERIAGGFVQIQEAWSGQDMRAARHLVSDGIFERFSLQLEMMKASSLINRMTSINILETRIVSIDANRFFDSVNVMVRASACDTYINSRDNEILSGIPEPEEFVEFWTLLRRPGAKTSGRPGLFECCCPNCGAPLEKIDRTECASCHAIVNSGEYDWVLTEITQASEWNYRPPRIIAGIETLQAADPTFNPWHIEDRSSVIFYRFVAAQFFADPRYMAKLADAGFMHQYKEFFVPLNNGRHRYYADAAVGGIELIDVINASGTEECDRLRVKVSWSGHQEEMIVPGLIRPEPELSTIFCQEFILCRKKGAKTSDKNILSSVHCPGCGAPEARSDKPYCEYCRAPLNDGSRDWVLDDIRPFSGYPRIETDEAAHNIYSRPSEISGKVRLDCIDADAVLGCAAAIMMSDGEIDDKETELLKSFAQSKKVSGERLALIIDSVKAGTLECSLPEGPAAKEFIRAMVLMCLADGKVTSSERRMLESFAAKLSIPLNTVYEMMRKERSALFKKVRQL